MKLFKKSPSLAVCAFSAMFALGVGAETLTVTSNADSGEGTLRQLIADSAAGDEVVIPSGMTITLSSLIALPNRSLTVRGADKSATVSGGGMSQLFEINNAKIGGRRSPIRIEFADLTLCDASSATFGAAFKTTDTASTDLVVTGCDVKDLVGNMVTKTDNREPYQCGVFLGPAGDTFQLFVTNSTFTGIKGMQAIYGVGNNWSAGLANAVFKKCRFEHNTGIGVFHVAPAAEGQFLAEDCVFANNAFTNGRACVCICEADKGSVIFRRCTVTNNVLSAEGDSLYTTLFNFTKGGGHLVESSYIADNLGLHNVLAHVGQAARSATFSNCIIERNETTSANDPNNYSHCGMIYAVVTDVPGLVTITNCVFRENVSRDYCLLGGNGGGGYRFVDSLFEDNKVFCPFIFNGAKTTDVERCAFVGNRRHPDSTKASSSPIFNSSRGASFRNVLFFGNNMDGNRYLLDGTHNYENCTIVSNAVAKGWVGISGLSGGVRFKNNVLLGLYNFTNGAAENDLSIAEETDNLGNCYVQRMSKTPVTPSVICGKSAEDLKLSCVLTTNGSNTVFLDGTRMPTLAFAKASPLRNAAAVIPGLGGLDLVRGKRGRLGAPDIGCWEFPETALMLIVR